MRNFFIFTLFLAVTFGVYGQVSVGRSSIGPFKDFRKGEYDLIKSKHTIFVVDDFSVADFDKIAKGVWTITPYTVVTRAIFENDREKYITESNAIMLVEGYVRTVTSSSGMTTEYVYVNYGYFYPTDIKKNKKNELKYDRNEIASVFLSGDSATMWELIRTANFGDLNKMYNYRLGYFKNYLQYINDLLRDKDYAFAYDKSYDKKEIKALATATLYVPDYMKTKSVWGYKDEERANPDELFKKYDFKYQFIDDATLNEKILAGGKEDFYYLMYTRVNGQKIISVINGRTGKIIYKDYQTMSYSIKPKDLSELSSAID
ncbi:DUF4835 domain-containing protein [Flavobacterium longum]|uniref:hypothetical protein n=1 Tax=Flavobacterium longum TaxID=1299340 RepID=UPI0039E7ADE1